MSKNDDVDPSVIHDVLENLVIASRDPDSDIDRIQFNEKTGNWEFQTTYETVLKVAGEKLSKETEEFLEDFPERLV